MIVASSLNFKIQIKDKEKEGYSFRISHPSKRSINPTSSMKGMDMGIPPSGLFASRLWYPFEKVRFAPDSRFLISAFDTFTDNDSFGSILTVKDPAGSVS